jgi:hypothetical protein
MGGKALSAQRSGGSTTGWVDATTGGRYEGCAKARALELLDAAGQRALNVGAGTGLDHRRLQAAVLLGFEG